MSIEIKVPVLPESVTDATVVAWHKKEGDTVARDEHLVDIETDKVVLEVVAPNDGVLEKILKGAGSIVTAKEVIAMFREGAGAGATKHQNPADTTSTSNSISNSNSASSTSASDAAHNPSGSPHARRLAQEHDLKIGEIHGSGTGGKILAADVTQHLHNFTASPSNKNKATQLKLNPTKKPEAQATASGSGSAATAMAPASAVAPSAATFTNTTNVSSATPMFAREEKRVPMTRLRARIAERLLQAQHNAAILTTFNEINMQPVMDLRNKYKDKFEKDHGVRLGFMSFFTKAASEALKRFPEVNASIDGSDIVYHGYFDIGIAVSSPRGLVVPILKDADLLSLADIERKIKELGDKAKNNQLSIEEITGGTFTISNGGVFGSLMATPILNPPQSAILGMHKIEDRPVVENKQIVIRPMMYVALSYDHRIIDGRESVQFLLTIKEILEDPARLILGV